MSTEDSIHEETSQSLLEEFQYFPDASNYFLGSYYETGNREVVVRSSGDSHHPIGGPLKLTLLRLGSRIRRCGTHKNSEAVDIYHFIVMDGHHSVFKAVVNSGESRNMPVDDLHNGTTLIVTEWRLITMDSQPGEYKKGILFINKFDWRPAPSYAHDEDQSTITPEFSTVWIDRALIDFVEKENRIVFTELIPHRDGFSYRALMSNKQFLQGAFLPTPESKKIWMNENGFKKKKATTCACRNEPYFFDQCITLLNPISCVDVGQVFDEVHSKLRGRVSADSFDDLKASHKRWCLYWCYAVNFFQLKGCAASPLPTCFVATVRAVYPDPQGTYVGFKSKQQHLDEQIS